MMLMYTRGTLIIGITRRNVDILQAGGNPASVTLPDDAPWMHIKSVTVMYGVDKPAILRQLEAVGMDVAAYKTEADRDPS